MSTITDPFQSPVTRLTTGIPGKTPVKPPVAAPVPPVQVTTPPKVPVTRPKLVKPTGPPVEALTQLGFWGSIQDFNNQVAKAHQSYLHQFGIQPDQKTLLRLATQAQPVDYTNPNMGLVAPPVPPTSPKDVTRLLTTLKMNAHTGATAYTNFMNVNSDVLSGLLADPDTHAETLKAMTWAAVTAHQSMGKPQNAVDTLKTIGETVLRKAVDTPPWVLAVSLAAGEDANSADLYLHTNGKKGSVSFPNLTKTSPAVAQVVKGLVYSPLGAVATARAVAHDVGQAEIYARTGGKEGSVGFTHTMALAKAQGVEVVRELNDPRNNVGNLLLLGYGVASGGAGLAGRVSRGLEGEGVAGTVAGLRSQSPLKTAELVKDGYAETITLSSNPLTALAQKQIAEVQNRLSNGGERGVTVEGAPIESFAPDKLHRWVGQQLAAKTGLNIESRIGRAGTIRRDYEARALSSYAGVLNEVAGNAARKTWLDKIIPDSVAGGLNAGEAKALQAASWDVPGGWGDKIDAEIKLHQNMKELGFGTPKLHDQQIGLLQVARREIANPSERLVKGLDAVQKAAYDAEALRLRYGLAGDVAEARVANPGLLFGLAEHAAQLNRLVEDAKQSGLTPDPELVTQAKLARDQVAEGVEVRRTDDGMETKIGDQWVPVELATDTSWYSPLQKDSRAAKRAGREARLPSSTFGIGPSTTPVWESHRMTGEVLRSGDINVDVPHLTADGLVKAARGAVQVDAWQKLWDHASEVQGEGQVPIRDISAVPDPARPVAESFLNNTLDDQQLRDLPGDIREYLLPDPEHIGPNEHVRYINPDLAGQLVLQGKQRYAPVLEAAAKTVFEPVNNLARPFVLYEPKYLLNFVGQAGMAVFDQGFVRAGENFARALGLRHSDDRELVAKIEALSGAEQGRATSYLAPGANRVSQWLGKAYGNLTDRDWRNASFLYYADRAGFHTHQELHDLVFNPDNHDTMLQVAKMGEDAQVAYNRMGVWEKSVLRHLIFVYPWQRGALVWSLKSLVDHPAKSALLNTMGQQQYREDPWLKEAVGWVKRAGYIPYMWDGLNKVGIGDPTSVTAYSTLAQIAQTGKAVTTGDQWSTVGDMFGVPAQFLTHAATGADSQGNKYQGSQILGALEDTLNIFPLVSGFQRGARFKNPPLKELSITDRGSLEARLNSALKQSVLDPGWLNGWAQAISGGLAAGRQLNWTASAARYWNTADPKLKQQHHVDFAIRMLALQNEFLTSGYPSDKEITALLVAPLGSVKSKVPEDLRKAVVDASQISYANDLRKKDLGRNLTLREQAEVTIDYFRKSDRMTAGQASQARAALAGVQSKKDIGEKIAALNIRYGHGQALIDFQDLLSKASGLRQPENLNARLSVLHQYNMAPAKVETTQTERDAYGRAYADYIKGRTELAREKFDNSADKAQQLRIYDDQHSKPVGGLPSPATLFLTEGTSAEAQTKINHLVTKRWGGLSGVDKAALGVKVPDNLSVAWAAYDQVVKQVRSRDGAVTRDQKLSIVKQINGDYTGFMKDWQISQKARVERLYKSPVAGQIPDRAEFDQAIGDPARAVAKVMATQGDYANQRRSWKAYVNGEQMQAFLADRPELKAWIGQFPATFLSGLVNSG